MWAKVEDHYESEYMEHASSAQFTFHLNFKIKWKILMSSMRINNAGLILGARRMVVNIWCMTNVWEREIGFWMCMSETKYEAMETC